VLAASFAVLILDDGRRTTAQRDEAYEPPTRYVGNDALDAGML